MKKVVAALILLSTALPVSAADQGLYAGAALGRSNMSNIGATVLTSPHDSIYSLLTGYQLNKNFAVETQYTGAGKYEFAPATGRTDAVGLAAVGILRIFNDVSLYGKLSLANTNATPPANALPYTGARRTTATYGLGAQYNVTSNLGVRLGWDQYGSAINTGDGTTQDYASSNWTCGAVLKF